MYRRSIEQLAICNLEEEKDTLPLEYLQEKYKNSLPEIIYVCKNLKLYGVICLGEIARCGQDGVVKVNRNFTKIAGNDFLKAYRIFRRKVNIYKIPIVNECGELTGDYSRGNDLLYIEYNYQWFGYEDVSKQILGLYDTIYLVDSKEENEQISQYFKDCMKEFGIAFSILDQNSVRKHLREKSLCIFWTGDELRGTLCSLHANKMNYDKEKQSLDWKLISVTYKDLLHQMKQEKKQYDLRKIQNFSKKIPYRSIDEKPALFLSALKKKGIHCFCLYGEEDIETTYGYNFKREVESRLSVSPIDYKEPWLKGTEGKEFYGELYQETDYQNQDAQREINESFLTCEYRKNITGKYFNQKNGRRKTCFWPEEYIGTIYLLGACTITGYVEDQFTIGSYLQKRLLETGYKYRVENLGLLLSFFYSGVDLRLQEIEKFNKNDIVILQLYNTNISDVPGISMEKIFEKYQIPGNWVTDGYFHCNHKANERIAESILEMIKPHLFTDIKKYKTDEIIKADVSLIMKDYIYNKYLKYYFSDFETDRYSSIGGIVLGSNLFTKGHRFIIEQSKQYVDFLILFVVEEDAFLFPFEERLKMVAEGVKDLENVMVVPSGCFILSKFYFEEYFTKIRGMSAVTDAEYSAKLFADYIAEPLHITHYFAGAEQEDTVKGVYNQAMRNILLQRGIDFVEMSKIKIEDEIVSSNRIMRYLLNKENKKAFTFLPQTTRKYLEENVSV